MATPISGALNELAHALATYTDSSVELGHPAKSESEICIFPYKLSEEPFARGISVPNVREKPDISYSLHCLIFPSPSNNYPIIDIALQFLIDTPVLDFSDYRAALMLDSALDLENCIQIFIGANIELSLSIPVAISITPAT